MAAVTLDEVYTKYYEKVKCLVRRKISDTNEVEDFTQDIFLKIAQNIEKYDPEKASLSTWVYTVSNRMIVDYYRSRKIFDTIPEENGEEGHFPSQLIDDQGLDAGLLKEEQLQTLADALGKLKQKERDLIILHYYSNMTLKEVAIRMGMSYANAKIIHKKAIGKLNLLMCA
ncbi:MAG: sigma-70 family RNA polymerase sigma factor [Eubacteriales bacterium]|nr:sigma-70 family RNA polymerase sigma factor [Eubacteriales bacterium]